MADDSDKDQRRTGDDATVQIPAELLSILPPPAEPVAPPSAPPPPPGPPATLPPPPPPGVTTSPAPPPRGPVDDRRGGGWIWLVGALVVVVLFVAVCYLVVAQAENDRPTGTAGPTTTTEGSATTAATTAPPPATQDPASLTVVVLNASGQRGWAGENVDRLTEAGYTGEASDAAADGDVSTIYIADESLRADGAAVATAVGLPDAPVEIRPEEPLGQTPAPDTADVVVVLGADSLG